MPPFPVVAAHRPPTTTPPVSIPHLKLRSEVLAPEPEPITPPLPEKGLVHKVIIAVVLLAAVGTGGFFAWKHFGPTAAPAPAKPAAPAASAPKPAATASETLNKIAHAPANAIKKAEDAIAARRASEQSRVDGFAAGEDGATRKFGVPPAAPATTAVTARKELAPGLSATTEVDAAANASTEFRTFVANVKVSGVFQGSPARAVINGKLTRVGETVEARLGIVFAGVESSPRKLVFKDRSGATVGRQY